MSDEQKPTADEDEAAAKPAALVGYVVQRQLREASAEGEKYDAWIDIATVLVPPRTKRSTVIKEGLKKAGVEPSSEPLKVRALDVDSAEVHEPEPYQAPAEWRL